MTTDATAKGTGPREWSTGQRVATIVIVAGLMAHMFFTFVYNVPNDRLRDTLPTGTAARYMEPLFVQDYKIFAPEPASADHRLWVRAWLDDGTGEPVTTEWLDVTGVELSVRYRQILRKHLTIIGAERQMSAYSRLTTAQKAVAAGNYHRLGLDRLYQDLLEASPDANPGPAASMVRTTRFLDGYATQVAYARGATTENLAAVQTRVVYDPVVPWSRRNDPDAERPPATITDTGWRRPVEYPDQDRDAFARTFLSWMDE